MNLCIIGITFLFASIYSIIVGHNKDIFLNFNQLLNDEQKYIYQNIIRERLRIYIIALCCGLLSGIYYYHVSPKHKYKWCGFLAIVYIVKLGVYYFYPKSPLMLYSLTTKEQTDAWADIYTAMKTRYRVSLLIGFIGYVIIEKGLQ
jgi:hypothetical protein